MGVKRYVARGKTLWCVDEWLTLPDGRRQRFRQREIPTRELAKALLAKAKSEAFEGRFFDRRKESRATVAELWDRYCKAERRHRRSLASEEHRGRYIKHHLGGRPAMQLTLEDVESYRDKREAEPTVRGKPPAVATVNREVALLRRVLNWSVESKLLPHNPLASVSLVEEDNVRRTVIDEETLERLLEAADPVFAPIILTAYDTGMRREEILALRRSQVNLGAKAIELAGEDTKTGKPRLIVLTGRLVEALRQLPRDIRSDFVFVNPKTGKRWNDVRKQWRRACREAGVEGAWFHDLRRSFVTNARRRGIPESVVMRMSGHRTRAVFERYNVVEEEDLREAARRLEAGTKIELGRHGQSLVKAGSKGR